MAKWIFVMDHNIYCQYLDDFKHLLEQGELSYTLTFLETVMEHHSSSGLLFLVIHSYTLIILIREIKTSCSTFCSISTQAPQ